MSERNKLIKFAEMKEMSNCFEPPFKTTFKSKWNEVYFKNKNKIVLELGCGTGNYTISLAEMFPDINFIGVDIKGARMWKGAKTALERNLLNVAFLRTRIEFLEDHFAENEVDEIWITFPDPQPKKENKRLTFKLFLDKYKKILQEKGAINLKTDSKDFFDYSLETFKKDHIKIEQKFTDLYSKEISNPILKIQTTYEKRHLEQGRKIYYLRGRL